MENRNPKIIIDNTTEDVCQNRVFIVGGSGSGKTTLLKRIAYQAIANSKKVLICAPKRINCDHIAPISDSVFHFTNNTSGLVSQGGEHFDLVIVDDACNISDSFWDKLIDVINIIPSFAIAGTPCVVNYIWDEERRWESDCYFKNMIDAGARGGIGTINLPIRFDFKCVKDDKTMMYDEDFRTQILGEWVCNYIV